MVEVSIEEKFVRLFDGLVDVRQPANKMVLL